MYLARKVEISHVYLYTFSMHYSSMSLQIITANHMKLNSVFRKKKLLNSETFRLAVIQRHWRLTNSTSSLADL